MLGGHGVVERLHPDVVKIAEARSGVRVILANSGTTLRTGHVLKLVSEESFTVFTHDQLHVVEVRQLVTFTRQGTLYVIPRGRGRLHKSDSLVVEAKHDTPP